MLVCKKIKLKLKKADISALNEMICTCTIYSWTSGRRQPKKIYIEKLQTMTKGLAI